jgi:hypothetical protein
MHGVHKHPVYTIFIETHTPIHALHSRPPTHTAHSLQPSQLTMCPHRGTDILPAASHHLTELGPYIKTQIPYSPTHSRRQPRHYPLSPTPSLSPVKTPAPTPAHNTPCSQHTHTHALCPISYRQRHVHVRVRLHQRLHHRLVVTFHGHQKRCRPTLQTRSMGTNKHTPATQRFSNASLLMSSSLRQRRHG